MSGSTKCNKDTAMKYRIVVIGAGAAGLGAARWLLDNDVDEVCEVIVLEARERIGGRIHSATLAKDGTNLCMPIDLGATWLHDHKPTNPLSIMAAAMSVPLQRTFNNSELVVNITTGEKYSKNELESAYKVFEDAKYTAVREHNVKSLRRLNQQNKNKSNASSHSTEDPVDVDLETLLRGRVGANRWGGGGDSASVTSVGRGGGDAGRDRVKGRDKSGRGSAGGSSTRRGQVLQVLLCELDFELGVSARHVSPAAIDRDWCRWSNPTTLAAARNDDSDSGDEDSDDEVHMAFPETGFVGLMHGLVDGRATDNDAMRCRRRVSGSGGAAAKRVIDVRTGHTVINVTDHSRATSASTSTSVPAVGCTVHYSTSTTTGPSASSMFAHAVVCTLPLGVLKHHQQPPSPVPSSPLPPSSSSAAGSAPPSVTNSAPASAPTPAPAPALFSPPLSEAKQTAISRAGFGNVVKVVLDYSSDASASSSSSSGSNSSTGCGGGGGNGAGTGAVFWPPRNEMFILADEGLCSGFHDKGVQQRGLCTWFWNLLPATGKPVLVAYALGDAADTVDQMSDEELLQLIQGRLEVIAGAAAGGESQKGRSLLPPRWLRTSWKADPCTRGSYSYVPVGATLLDGDSDGIWKELARPESASLHFAGESTNTSSALRSCVRGAWVSGIRAAEEVTRSLPEIRRLLMFESQDPPPVPSRAQLSAEGGSNPAHEVAIDTLRIVPLHPPPPVNTPGADTFPV